jgi:Tfp pilus assembly protein PilO
MPAILVVPLFLATRVMATAAPARGRRLGRWLLVLGTVAAAIAVAAAYGVGLERWPPEAEGFALTVFVLSPLLLLAWAVAVAARVVRWMRKAPPLTPPTTRGEAWRLALLAGIFVVLGVLVQWLVYRHEASIQAARLESLRKTLRAMEVTANKLPEFKREVALLREKQRVMLELLPTQLGVQEFMDGYREVCAVRGFRIRSWSVRAAPPRAAAQTPVARAEIDLVLEGDPERASALGTQTERMRRLVDWRMAGADEDTVRAQIVVYALPEERQAPVADACRIRPRSEVFLWPYRGRVRAAYAERAHVCAELERLAPVRTQVDAFEREREGFRARVDAAERLMAERGATEIVPSEALPAPRGPEPTPAAAPRRGTRKQA